MVSNSIDSTIVGEYIFRFTNVICSLIPFNIKKILQRNYTLDDLVLDCFKFGFAIAAYKEIKWGIKNNDLLFAMHGAINIGLYGLAALLDVYESFKRNSFRLQNYLNQLEKRNYSLLSLKEKSLLFSDAVLQEKLAFGLFYGAAICDSAQRITRDVYGFDQAIT